MPHFALGSARATGMDLERSLRREDECLIALIRECSPGRLRGLKVQPIHATDWTCQPRWDPKSSEFGPQGPIAKVPVSRVARLDVVWSVHERAAQLVWVFACSCRCKDSISLCILGSLQMKTNNSIFICIWGISLCFEQL